MEVRLATWVPTPKVVVDSTHWHLPVIVTVPSFTPVASPVWLMPAMLELDELHFVSAVTSPVEEVVPPEVMGAPKVPVAVYCCVAPG